MTSRSTSSVWLAVDTSAGTSVAVLGPDGVLVEHTSEDPLRHAEAIGQLLKQTLQDAGVRAQSVSTVAYGIGPGPFTGLRVGIAAAKAFALGVGAATVPVVSHDAPAWEAWQSGQRGEFLVLTDARRRELYWSAYRLDESDYAAVEGPALIRATDDPRPGASRVQLPAISAGALIRAAHCAQSQGRPAPADRAMYLRAPDATPSAGPKRVTR